MNGRGASVLPLLAVPGFLVWLIVTTRPDRRTAPPLTPAPPAGLEGAAVPCQRPLAWRVADVDPRFELSLGVVEAAAGEAAELWRIEARGPLFVRDSLVGMPIRLVYDERQARTDERVRAERLQSRSESDLATEESALRLAREAQTEAQQRSLVEWAAHDSAVAAHNAAVRRWNAAGDAPSDTAAVLTTRGDRLRANGVTLLEAARRLRADEADLRSRERALAEARAELGRDAARLASAFPPLEVESGAYLEAQAFDFRGAPVTLREIRVFRFESRNDLVRTLAHELGHALGLAHVDGAGAVMSPRREGSDRARTSLHAADRSALAALCADSGLQGSGGVGRSSYR